MELLPEKIEGIPTEKKLSKERREIVRKEYIRLIESLQKRCGKKAVYNNFLRTDVFIIMRESEKIASNSAAFNWQSTYAVKHLLEVIRDAMPVLGRPIYTIPKSNGKQKEFGYVNMATLYHQFHSAEHDYLNFTVKLVLGVKNDKRHIQYSVNKIEVI
jgi:hypothetical protein